MLLWGCSQCLGVLLLPVVSASHGSAAWCSSLLSLQAGWSAEYLMVDVVLRARFHFSNYDETV